VRLFAIEHFHHFASMAIGVAMLGFGASGTLLTLRRQVAGVLTRQFGSAALLTGVLLMAVPATVELLPLMRRSSPSILGSGRGWPCSR
jgi:hypothetical protein